MLRSEFCLCMNLFPRILLCPVEVDTADAGVHDRTTRLFQMVKDRDYDDEEEEIVDDEDDGLMPLSEEPDEMKRVRHLEYWRKQLLQGVNLYSIYAQNTGWLQHC